MEKPEATPSAAQDAAGIGSILDQLKNRCENGKKPVAICRDGFPIYEGDPFSEIHQLLDSYLGEIPDPGRFWYPVNPKSLASGFEILKFDPEKKASVVRAITVRVLYSARNQARPKNTAEQTIGGVLLRIGGLFGASAQSPEGGSPGVMNTFEFHHLTFALLQSSLPLTADDLSHMVGIVADRGERAKWSFVSPELVLRGVERFAVKSSLSPELRNELHRWKRFFEDKNEKLTRDNGKLFSRIKTLLGEISGPEIVPGEAWSNAAIADLQAMSSEQRSRWHELLQHCQKADGSKPSNKWSKRANELVEAVGRAEVKQTLLKWFELVALPRPVHQEPQHQHLPDPDQLIADPNSLILKGLVWCCACWEDEDLTRAVSRLAQVCFKKIRNLGARCPRIGNACLYSLSVTTTDTAAAELSRLGQTVKQPSAKKLVSKSLDKAAELTGQTRDDLEESSVPTYGLDENGRFSQTIGEFTGEFSIVGPDAFELVWRKADGTTQKSVPAEIKEAHSQELKNLKRTLKDIQGMLPAQRRRIEQLLASEREWELGKWRERYLDHALLKHVTRRLIWHFWENGQRASGIWHEGQIVDNQDRSLDWLSPATRVRLWHPLGEELQTVAAWRQWLENHEVTQPFKQAHREIYLLTDAELVTNTYSNRFAAHVIRQHQFAALARERGWTYLLQGGFDSHNTPTIVLPRWNLRVEFWVESPAAATDELSNAGIFLNLSTDQVRFCDLDGQPRPLSEVPALIFSEMMRDVDLFVGVCSIGNDPAWHDRGEQFGTYWHDFSFGDLSATATTRREVLSRLLPRLKIAGQCELQDKFLVVRGKLRTYKIHLGSSNILMEPNDAYLCIVPNRAQSDPVSRGKLLLPFEGDSTFAVILSKAFLLAEDWKIKDPGILRQINGK